MGRHRERESVAIIARGQIELSVSVCGNVIRVNQTERRHGLQLCPNVWWARSELSFRECVQHVRQWMAIRESGGRITEALKERMNQDLRSGERETVRSVRKIEEKRTSAVEMRWSGQY